MATNDQPSLIQRYQAGHLNSNDQNTGDHLASNLPTGQQSTDEQSKFISDAVPDLQQLRTTSHELSEESKNEKAKIAAVKAKVDQARLDLENRRLEERELREEIRRESDE